MANVTPLVVKNGVAQPLDNTDTLTRPNGDPIVDTSDPTATHRARVIRTTNITNLATGAPNEVDGVNLSTSDLVLVVGQTDPVENGLYSVSVVGTGSDGEWARAAQLDENEEINAAIHIQVTEGSIHAGELWTLSALGGLTIGVSALNFIKVITKRSRTAYSANGYSVTGADLSNSNLRMGVIPKSGTLVFASVTLDTSTRTAGTIAIVPYNFTTSTDYTNLSLEIGSTTPTSDSESAFYGSDNNSIVAGQVFGVRVTTTGFEPIPVAYTITLEFEFDADNA